MHAHSSVSLWTDVVEIEETDARRANLATERNLNRKKCFYFFDGGKFQSEARIMFL